MVPAVIGGAAPAGSGCWSVIGGQKARGELGQGRQESRTLRRRIVSSYTAVEAPHEDIDQEAGAVHAWRVSQLVRLGLAWDVAEAVADRVDWHDVAKLVQRGCPAALAVSVIE